MSVCWDSGCVRKVTDSQIAVVTATVMIMIQAKSIGLSLFSPAAVCSSSEVTKAPAIAEISLQALMRHQYQRSRYTLPVPAPVTISSFHAPAIESRLYVMMTETTVMRIVAHREAHT